MNDCQTSSPDFTATVGRSIICDERTSTNATAASSLSMDGGALRLVDFYREHLSGHKHSHCAAGLAGHETCSTANRPSIADVGLIASIRPAIRRFKRCCDSVVLMGQGPMGGPMGGPGGGPMGGGGGFMGGGFMGRGRMGGGRCCLLPL